MKKILAVALVVCTIGLGPAFAAKQKEFDLTFNLSPTHKFTEKEDFCDVIMKELLGFGLGFQWNWFFGSPKKWIDIGLNFDWNNDVVFKLKPGTKYGGSIYWDDTSKGFGYHLDFILGPAIRFNLGERNSFLISPGFKFGFGFMGTENFDYITLTMTPQFNLDLGYRFWASEKFGICVGADLAWGKGSMRMKDKTLSESTFEKEKLDKSFAATIYLGFSFRKGASSGKSGKGDSEAKAEE